MTPRPLTDERLAAGLRAHLPVPDAALRERILAATTTTAQDRPLPSILAPLGDADPIARRRTILLVALLAVAATASAAAIAGALLRERPAPDPVIEPPLERASVTPTPTRDVRQVVNGWPDTNENASGLYSWDGSACGSTRSATCIVGFMHNGYGSGDVSIRIEVLRGGLDADDGATATTVAGHAGFHRRIDATTEQWTVEIDGRTIGILLIAKPGTSQADLAEARAIIDSMSTEPRDNVHGFRLVFTLATDDWDSG